MIVTIMQPAYLPWLGYFERIARSDLLISLDHVHMDANSKTKFANRNKIRTPDGWAWLTVPVRSKGLYENMKLDRLEIETAAAWRRKHWRSIETNYQRAPYFDSLAPRLEAVFEREWTHLVPLCDVFHGLLCEILGIETPVVKSSALGIATGKQQLILDLCRAKGATKYVSGPFGRDYLEPRDFTAAGIELVFHDYDHPKYAQAFAGFQPYMSMLDLILNHGPASRDIFRSDRPFSST